MPFMVLTAAHVTIDSNDLSDYATKIELSVEVDEKDVTNYASNGWKVSLGGLKSGSLSLDFKQDFASGELDATMWPLLGDVVSFVVRADQASAGASNPQYSGNVLISQWNPITGSVGDDATVSVTYPTSGAVERGTGG